MKVATARFVAYQVNVTGEDCLVPADLIVVSEDLVREAFDDEGYCKSAHLADFASLVRPYLRVQATVFDIQRVDGWFARLSAPGYMDATDWLGPYESEKEAAEEVMSLFDCDEDGNDIDG